MTQWVVPQFESSVGEQEAAAAAACVRSGWITEGIRSAEFVERIKEIAGVKYGVLAPNGTLALYLALKACGVERGWRVIVPDLTFVATATAVAMTGAEPIFCDVDEYGQLDWGWARKLWLGLPTMYLPVHLYGMGQDIPTADVAQRREHCVEDACQALGVVVDGKPCGSLGKASAFSFFADKTITTGEGGFVGTNDEGVYERLRFMRNQGRVDRGSFVHPQVGWNFRMTDIHAAVGLVQLNRMADIVERKRAIHEAYCLRFAGVPGLRVLQPPVGSTHIPFRTVVFFEGSGDAGDARVAESFLRARGIEPRSAFYPLHRQPCFAELVHNGFYGSQQFVNANYFWDHALCLPTWAGMSESQVSLVAETVVQFARTGDKRR